SNPQGEEAPAPKLWANPPRIVDVEFRVQCDSFVCNAHKGTNIAGLDPSTRKLCRLFDPRTDEWETHFQWDGPLLLGLTPVGRTTIAVLEINQPIRVRARAVLIREGAFP
ncbi:MAG TPA: hypothetical protein VN541_12840, partial [Tepidisphaeraceae bacterium]|nr:hypothetical protein [Tepidisphaeraceae bacterium]